VSDEKGDGRRLQIHVGEGFAAAAARVVDAWRRADRGEAVATAGEHHVTFESWEGLSRVLTPKRLELLRALRRRPAASVAGLARTLGRDYKRVHEDVEALVAAGLVNRAETGLRADYDEIRATIAL
jgi:predicted transcriptional regulator